MVDRFLTEFARSTRDLLNVMDAVGKAGAGFRSLADHCGYKNPTWQLSVDRLGGLAEFERELIRARTDEGRSEGQRGPIWEEAQAHTPSARGGHLETGGGRTTGRNRSELQHDFMINYRRIIIALDFLSSILSTGGAPLPTSTERM